LTLFKPIEEISVFFNGSIVGGYFFKYLNKIQAKSFLIESNYIDKDFLIDYSNYYSRSFREIPKTTDRIHFFSAFFNEREFLSALEKGDLT
jgi:hypothetical protein